MQLLFHLVAAPRQQLNRKLLVGALSGAGEVSDELQVPGFKVGTLDQLVLAGDELMRQDAAIEQAVVKMAEQLRGLLSDGQESQLAQMLAVNGKHVSVAIP